MMALSCVEERDDESRFDTSFKVDQSKAIKNANVAVNCNGNLDNTAGKQSD